MDNLKYVSNNVNGLSTSDTDRIKIFLYLQNTITNNGIIFWQETHSTTESAQKLKKYFGKDNELFLAMDYQILVVWQ